MMTTGMSPTEKSKGLTERDHSIPITHQKDSLNGVKCIHDRLRIVNGSLHISVSLRRKRNIQANISF